MVDTSSMSEDVLGRIQRTEAYAEYVRKMFAATVNKIAALRVTAPKVDNGEMYSFDGDNIRIRQQVEQLLRQLHSVVVFAIEKGISLEWEAANRASDKLLKRVYGSKLLNSNVFRGWNSRNSAAQEAFIQRSDRGMNLSQRVWKSCRQLRDEMEVALTVSIGEGEDAGTISRRIRQYLNDPDLMFRRFRYKIKEPMRDDKGNIVYGRDGKPKMQDKLDANGKPIWGKKWKKRVIDHTTGKVTFIDYDKDSYKDQWTGPGYYKSAAKNAMRVARTETNIAYRRADCERWKQLDFVLGYRVELSKNHPEVDICDELQGDYPKDFIFDGWHPQCFCHAVPILVEPDEMLRRNEARANGEEYIPKGEPITDVPEKFKKWVEKNSDKILESHKLGTDPYFVRNNFGIVDRIINPHNYKPAVAADIDGNETPVLTTAQIAAKRIAARTPEYIAEVSERWEQHRRNEISKAVGELQGKGWKPMSEIKKIKDDSKKLELLLQNCDIISAGDTIWGAIKTRFRSGTMSDTAIHQSVAMIESYYQNTVKGMDILAEIHKMDVKSVPFEWLGDIKKLVREVNNIPLSQIAEKNLNGIETQTLEHLQNIGRLVKDKYARFYGLEKLSTKTPQDIFRRFATKDITILDELPPKEFFDGFKYFVRLEHMSNGAECGWGKIPVIRISNEERFLLPKGFKSVIVHEGGHAYDRMSNDDVYKIWSESDTELRKDFDAIKGVAKDKDWLNKVRKAVSDKLSEARKFKYTEDELDKFFTECTRKKNEADEQLRNGLITKEECELRKNYAQQTYENYKVAGNHRFQDLRETVMTLDDILESMNPSKTYPLGYGGHGSSYWLIGKNRDLCEFIAHCSESRYMDFSLIKEVAPEVYDLLQKYAKKYWGD